MVYYKQVNLIGSIITAYCKYADLIGLIITVYCKYANLIGSIIVYSPRPTVALAVFGK